MDSFHRFNMLQRIPMSGTTKQICFGMITLLIYVSLGVCRSYVAFLLHQLDLPDSTLRLDDSQKTWLASSLGLLTPFASLGSGFVMDVFGRRTCILFMFVPFIIAWTIISVATTYTMLLIAMIVQSIALGMMISIITYVAEISTTKYRGLLLAMVDVTLNLGVIIASTLMYFFKWNTVSIIFIGTSVASLLLTLILPESPVWLYSKGKKEQAIEVLCALRSQQPHELEAEIKDMENSHSQKSSKTGVLIILKNCIKAWRQFIIASLLFILLIFAGPFILLSYTVLFIERLNSPYDAVTVALIFSIAGFCGSFLTPFFVHNLKRKVILSISSGGMTLSIAGILLYEIFFFHSQTKPCAWLVPLFLCTFTLLNNLGVLPIGFVIGGELFPLEARGTLQGMYGCLISFAWALSLKFYPIVLFNYGVIAMLSCFLVACLLLMLYALFILPETKGKTLNEVQEQYFGKKEKQNSGI